MKKILLIIAIIFLILQMIVLATDIDIGSAAINRDSATGVDFTIVDKNNPANDTGIITSVEIWANTSLVNCEVATFYVVSGNYLSTRDSHFIGNVTAGSKQIFNGLNIDVQAGDYIGIYLSSGGYIERSTTGAGYWPLTGDNIPCTNISFGFWASRTISLYGTGTTEEEEEEANAIFFGTAF